MTAITNTVRLLGKLAINANPASPASDELNRWQKMAARISTTLRVRQQYRSNDFRNPETQRTYLSFQKNIW